MVSTDSSFAGPMNVQVLTTRTSASLGSWVSSHPARPSRPIITSESIRFLAHPRETIPTLIGEAEREPTGVDIKATSIRRDVPGARGARKPQCFTITHGLPANQKRRRTDRHFPRPGEDSNPRQRMRPCIGGTRLTWVIRAFALSAGVDSHQGRHYNYPWRQ